MHQPLFLYVAFTAAHAPLQPLEEHLTPCSHLPHPWRRNYCGMVVGVDEAIGNLSRAMQESLSKDSILIFMSDNGGAPWFGGLNTPLRGGKGDVFEGGVRVPAFALDFTASPNAPGKYLGTPGRSFEGLVHCSDWFPTLVSWAGGSEVNGLDGHDLSVALLEGSKSPRNEVLLDLYDEGECVWPGEMVALRVGKFKLIQGSLSDTHWYSETSSSLRMNSTDTTWASLLAEWMVRLAEPIMGVSKFDTLRVVVVFSWLRSFHRKPPITLLFNLDEDPNELVNVAEDYPAEVAFLLKRAEVIKAARPPQQKYFMVVPDFDSTLAYDSHKVCTHTTTCHFVSPWIRDEDETASVQLVHVQERIQKLIRNSFRNAVLIAAAIVAILKFFFF